MRFTKKVRVLTSVSKDGKENWVETIEIDKSSEADKKWFEIENTEEELGIELRTLVKALKNGFYYKKESVIVHVSKDDLLLSSGAIHFAGKGLIFAGLFLHFKDYGKTWALTVGELK